MTKLILFALLVLSFSISAKVVKENMDDAFGYSYQKPVKSERKLAGDKESKSKDDKKRDVASDEIATDSDVKYWRYTP